MATACDYFAVLGLPKTLLQNAEALERNYLALCGAVHPDAHGMAGEAFLEASQERASLVNQAYQVLKDELSRAEHLLALCGGPDSASQRNMPPEILEQQLEWRERIEELENQDTQTLEAHLAKAKRDWDGVWRRLQTVFPENPNLHTQNPTRPDWRVQARELLNHGRFLRSLARDLDGRIHKNLLD